MGELGGGRNEQAEQRISRAEKQLCDSVIVDTGHYAFVKPIECMMPSEP